MIQIDMAKAKAIAHTRRRAAREADFAPLDAVIAKQIPGHNNVAAEAERAAIRAKYAAMQSEIDIAQDIAGLKAALEAA
jgi:hypothetical protein